MASAGSRCCRAAPTGSWVRWPHTNEMMPCQEPSGQHSRGDSQQPAGSAGQLHWPNGRSREIKGLGGSHGLVTLAGVGGSGKTRLAITPVSGWRNLPLGGSNFCLSRGNAGPRHVRATRWPRDGDSTRRHALDIFAALDNCEHLLSACCAMVDLILHSCPSVASLQPAGNASVLQAKHSSRVPPIAARCGRSLVGAGADAARGFAPFY
jgi:hypothetical protein